MYMTSLPESDRSTSGAEAGTHGLFHYRVAGVAMLLPLFHVLLRPGARVILCDLKTVHVYCAYQRLTPGRAASGRVVFAPALLTHSTCSARVRSLLVVPLKDSHLLSHPLLKYWNISLGGAGKAQPTVLWRMFECKVNCGGSRHSELASTSKVAAP